MDRNGWKPTLVPSGGTDSQECDTNQIIIGYIPAIFYSNMFSLAFLEIKSLTKISDTKSAKDFKIGITVIGVILFFYLSIYIVFVGGNAALNSKTDLAIQKQQFLVGIFNQFVRMPDPFKITEGNDFRSQFTYFDMYYILTSVAMVCQAVVFLQIARENLITFVEEHVNQKLSKNLDWKNRGMETKNKHVRRQQQELSNNLPRERQDLANESSQGLLS